MYSITDSSLVSPLKILIVDDFEPDIRLMQRMIGSRQVTAILPSCTMRSCDSIGKALSMYRSFQPDCILLDYNLPDMSGLDLVETLLATEGELNAAIVMMTGEGDENVAVQAMKLGVHDYLIKGQVSEEQLGWTIYSALERQHLQRQVADKQEELELFASRAAHDMVGPLTNLSLYIESLQEQYSDLIEDADESFDSIISIVDHITGLIDGLSTYAQVGRSTVPFDQVDLQELFNYVLLVSEADIVKSGADVQVGNLPIVYGDRVGLSQLFQNLIANAIKYSSEVVPQIRIEAREEEAHFHISVRDNGIGIDPMYHSEIFAPFRRLHNRSEYPGCGLGLTTCKKVIEQHSGQIWIESSPGSGATVHITLPKAHTYSSTSRFSQNHSLLDSDDVYHRNSTIQWQPIVRSDEHHSIDELAVAGL